MARIIQAIRPGAGTTAVFWPEGTLLPAKAYYADSYNQALALRRRLVEEGGAGAARRTKIIHYGGSSFVAALFEEVVA